MRRSCWGGRWGCEKLAGFWCFWHLSLVGHTSAAIFFAAISVPLQGAGAGVCARRRSNFLSLRRKKVTKERATLQSASLRFAAGNLRCAVTGCAVELALRLRRAARTTTASQITKRVCPAAHPPPRALRSSAHTEGAGKVQTAARAIALLGLACAARGACARECRGERSDGPCGLRSSNPLLAAPAAGRLRGEHARPRAHAS